MKVKVTFSESVKRFYHNARWFMRNHDKVDELSKLYGAFMYGPVTYNADGLATCVNADFIKDPKFAKAYAAAHATNPWKHYTLQWRVYIVCYFAELAKLLEGDFVECGVNTGAYAKAVITYTDLNSLNKTFYLFDTFEGLPSEQMTMEEKEAGLENYNDQYHDVYEQVQETFRNDNVQLVKGKVPGTLGEFNGDKVAFLSIDMNMVKPERAALEYFYDKIVPGGIIILDDYGFPQHINQKKAHDEFALKRGISILSLPTGQGIIFKR